MAVLSRSWLFPDWWGRNKAPVSEPEPGSWTCIVCERTFSADQPKFFDPEHAEEYDLCIDCSH
jgi:hypothetical protein